MGDPAMSSTKKSAKTGDRAVGSAGATSVLPWQAFWEYSADFWQRNILFADVLRQRGNQFLEHQSSPVQHVLHYDFERVMDGRELARRSS